MKKLNLLVILFLFTLSLSAQNWDGGGDGHSWNDALNWDNDQVPATGVNVEINANATIDGTAPNTPARVKIGANKTVVLDLDLSIGDGTIAEHGLIIGNKAILTLGSAGTNRTFNINTPNNKDAVAIFNNVTDAASPASLNILNGTTLNIGTCDDALNLTSTNGAFTLINDGTINVTNATNNGINHQDGTFINNGTLNINSPSITKGIRYQSGADSLVNNGTITITEPMDDGLEIGEIDFINNGTIDITVVSTATVANNGLVVITGGDFLNGAMGIVNADGGVSSNARTIVNEDGSITNEGVINVTGGNVGAAFRIQGGTTTNAVCGIINGNNGTRINADGGAFTNNGLYRSTHTGSGIFLGNSSTATVTNNGFFAYDNSNQFGAGQGGTVNDNGANVGTDSLVIDAGLTCTADLGVDLVYDLYDDMAGNNLVGTTDATGSVTFANNTFSSGGTQMLYTCFGDEFTVFVENVSGDCATVITIDSVDVTFIVNTNKPNFTVDAAGIFLAGGGNFGVPGDNPMNDADADGIYEITVRVPEGFSSHYTFTNGACTDWSCKEDISGQSCADPNNFNDRFLPAVYSDTTLSTCFGECSSDGSCPNNTTGLLIDDNLFTVAPTLAHNFTMIRFGNTVNYGTKTLRVINAVGQIIHTTIVENTDAYYLNTSDLPQGMYFINIQIEGRTATKRIVVTK